MNPRSWENERDSIVSMFPFESKGGFRLYKYPILCTNTKSRVPLIPYFPFDLFSSETSKGSFDLLVPGTMLRTSAA